MGISTEESSAPSQTAPEKEKDVWKALYVFV